MLKTTSSSSPFEIPFNHIKSSKIIFCILGLMVFLITLCLTSSVLLERLLQNWRYEAMHGFTVTLPSAADPHQQFLQQIDLMKLLKQIPGVLNIEIVTQENRSSIFDHWASSVGPLQFSSQKLEVTLDHRAKIDFSQVSSTLNRLIPNLLFETGRSSKIPLLNIAETAQLMTMILAGLIGITAILTIAFTTHIGLTIHARVIEILRLIGAENLFIAKKFQNYALNLSIKGGLLGFSLSTFFYLLLTSIFDLSSFSKSFPCIEIWSIMIFSPILVAVIIMISARMTVMFALSQEI